MARSARPDRPVRLLRRLVLALFSTEALYIPVYFLVQLPVLGLRQEMITTILLLFMSVVGLLWLAIWLTALVTALRRRERNWIRAFAEWGALAIAIVAFLYLADDPRVFVSFILNLLVLGRGYFSLAFFALIVIGACLLPVPLEVWHYANVLARKAH